MFYDKGNLLACSLTCRSWCITAVPHLHYTVTTLNFSFWMTKRLWPRRTYAGLVCFPWTRSSRPTKTSPLIPVFFCGVVTSTYKAGSFTPRNPYGFSPEGGSASAFYLDSLALTNIRELEIEDLDFLGFIPRVRRYFRHSLPAVIRGRRRP